RAINMRAVLAEKELEPIRQPLTGVCEQLSEIRKTKGGKKTYHHMVACYFHDLARVWISLRRVCATGSRLCFVIGDSAPYGIYVSAAEWLGELALAAGFRNWRFEKTRDRNVKWKNRKHRVPLCEGRLWVEG
ncbi:MAG: DNA modification methylase, partial [Rhodospirillales bacterium]|nr:DNA modification methylase [Rhodospirillales bacterium]